MPADRHSETKEFIRRWCSKLSVEEVDWQNASEPKRYNCMGFAVGVLKWWQPYERDRHGRVKNPRDYWPAGVPSQVTIDAYIRAAESVRFSCCDPGWEPGFEKIVLFYKTVGQERLFTHAARQVSVDRWKSKIGKESDIEHGEDIGCAPYGNGKIYMKRARIPSVLEGP